MDEADNRPVQAARWNGFADVPPQSDVPPLARNFDRVELFETCRDAVVPARGFPRPALVGRLILALECASKPIRHRMDIFMSDACCLKMLSVMTSPT